MSRAIAAELRKFLTTRMWWGMAIGVLAAGAVTATAYALLIANSGGDGRTSDLTLAQTTFTGGIQIGYLLVLAVGVLTIGSEYRHKTITSTFLAVPRRTTVMVAKVVSLLLIGAGYGVVFLVGSAGVGSVLLTAQGRNPYADATIWRTLLLALLALGLWSLIGLGAGILIPNQVAALLISVGVAWIVEPIAALVLSVVDWGKAVAPYLPSTATRGMLDSATGTTGPGAHVLVWWAAALVLAAYAAVMAGVGSALTVRRDIS